MAKKHIIIPSRQAKVEQLTKMNLEAIEMYIAAAGCVIREFRDIDDFSAFARALAEDNYDSKEEHRKIFRNHDDWDEDTDRLIIDGYKHIEIPMYEVSDVTKEILKLSIDENNFWPYEKLLSDSDFSWRNFIEWLCDKEELHDDTKKAFGRLGKGIYAEGKKKTKVLRALFNHFGLVDENKGSNYILLYSKLSDYLSLKEEQFKAFLTVGSPYFITMSNPNCDSRGQMLVSCHSLTSDCSHYRGGCSGYARDSVTMMLFQPSDFDDEETYFTRKKMRELFFYTPHGGTLVQSRLYDSTGGLYGNQSEKEKPYRLAVERALSICEDEVNLWDKVETYVHDYDNPYFCAIGERFSGYPDWRYSGEFYPKVVKRKGWEYIRQTVGAAGRCFKCGELTDYEDALLCEDCSCEYDECYHCGDSYPVDEMYEVYDEYGDTRLVCENCRDEYYRYCEGCGEYHHEDDGGYDPEGWNWYCEGCWGDRFVHCYNCGETIWRDDAIEVNGSQLWCPDCAAEHAYPCRECGEPYTVDNLSETTDGEYVCNDCADDYITCDCCEKVYPRDSLTEEEENSIVDKWFCENCREDNTEPTVNPVIASTVEVNITGMEAE